MTLAEDNFDPTEPGHAPAAGCCSAYVFPPLVVILIAVGAVLLAFRSPPGTLPAAAAPLTADSTPALAAVFTPEVQYWAAAITGWASNAGLDPNLAATVMQIESCGDPRALSRAGAVGLFQVMPYHFAAADQPFAPDTNAARGLAYLARAIDSAQGDARLAFAGYNGGIGVIGRSESSWPAETARYAYWGSGIYADAVDHAPASPRLQEWLAAGGASLCRAASARLGLHP